MLAKTTDGLLGANNAMNVIRTPMKVFKEARARGDTATMERAMGYVEKTNTTAWESKNNADEGLKQEAEENKLKQQQESEELAARIKAKTEEMQQKADNESALPDPVPTEEGETKAEGTNAAQTNPEAAIAAPYGEETADPLTYTKSGEVKPAEIEPQFNVVV